MATKHTCDRCGREVKSSSDLWTISVAPAKLHGDYPTGFRDTRRFESWEVCLQCKKKIYVIINDKS